MENTLYVAKKFYKEYAKQFNEDISEMKMHKLMYFAQRESLMYYKVPLFRESFLGWKYGPVLRSVRKEYKKDHPFADVSGEVSQESSNLVKSILNRYGSISPWKLSGLSHNELSWKMSRIGLNPEENGDKKLKLDTIRIDAIRELSRRK